MSAVKDFNRARIISVFSRMVAQIRPAAQILISVEKSGITPRVEYYLSIGEYVELRCVI